MALTLRPPMAGGHNQPPEPGRPTSGRDSGGEESGDHSLSSGEESLAPTNEIIGSHGVVEAGQNRAHLLEAIQGFARHWKVTPHVFFMLGKCWHLPF